MKLRQSMKPANNSFERRLGGDFVSRVFFAVYCYDELVCKILLRESNWTTLAAKSFALIVYWFIITWRGCCAAPISWINQTERRSEHLIHPHMSWKNVKKKKKKKQHRKSKQNKIQYRTLNSKSGREKCSMADVMTCPDKERKNEHNLTK